MKQWKTINTDHLEKRAAQRGFSIAQATETIQNPANISKVPPRRGNHGGMIWLFFRAYGDRVLIVVAETKKDACWIITGYWEETN